MATISDDFNRADNATTLGSTSVGAVAWQALQGTWGIGTNRAHVVTGDSTSPNAQVAVVPAGSPDGTVQATIAAVDGSGVSPFLIFRASDRLNYLYWVVNTGAIRQMVAGSGSLIGTAAGVTAGDVVKVVLSGTSVECFKNGTSVGAFTVSTHSTNTKHGIGSDSTVTGNYFDNFSWVPLVLPRGWVVGAIGW